MNGSNGVIVKADVKRMQEDFIKSKCGMNQTAVLKKIGRSDAYIAMCKKYGKMNKESLIQFCKLTGLDPYIYLEQPFSWDEFRSMGMERWGDEDEVRHCYDYYCGKDWKKANGTKIKKPIECFYSFEHNRPELKKSTSDNGISANDIGILMKKLEEIEGKLEQLSQKFIVPPKKSWWSGKTTVEVK